MSDASTPARRGGGRSPVAATWSGGRKYEGGGSNRGLGRRARPGGVAGGRLPGLPGAQWRAERDTQPEPDARTQVAIPNLVGMTHQTPWTRPSSSTPDLHHGHRSSPPAPGTVLSQSPAPFPGSQGTTIEVVISAGRRPPPCPTWSASRRRRPPATSSPRSSGGSAHGGFQRHGRQGPHHQHLPRADQAIGELR
jgi:hypothetical protein